MTRKARRPLIALCLLTSALACGGRTSLDGGDTPCRSATGCDDASTPQGGLSDAGGDTLPADVDDVDTGAPAPDGPRLDATADGAAPGQAVTTYLVSPGRVGYVAGPAVKPPLRRAWTASLGTDVSYPLLVNGVVYVTTEAPQGGDAQLLALDAATGSTVWKAALTGASAASLAYDRGRIFSMDTSYSGAAGTVQLRAFDAATGAPAWTSEPLGESFFNGPLAASGGTVYVYGEGNGGAVYAYDEAGGTMMWSAGTAGGDGAPALSSTAVFVSEGCQSVRALDRGTGALRWQHPGSCSGAGRSTPVLSGGALFVGDPNGNLVFDASTGAVLGTFASDVPPAFDGKQGYAVSKGVLAAGDPMLGAQTWTFTGDGRLATSPFVMDGYVYVGSTTGNFFVVDASTGALAWSENTGFPLQTTELKSPRVGIAGADGVVVVPAGPTLIAYVSAGDADGGAAADSGPASGCAYDLSLVSPSPTTGNEPSSLAIADFNGDGHPDFALTDSYDGNMSILPGHGDGTFGAHVEYRTTFATAVATGDFNRDGNPDLVVANTYTPSPGPFTMGIFLGHGDGTFASQVTYPTGTEPAAVAVGDLNGDGFADLAVAAEGLSIHLGRGDGTFLPVVKYSVGVGADAIALADLDGDGQLDAVVTASGGPNVSVLRGRGDGTFQPQQVYATGTTPTGVAVGDVNGDGQPDLAVSNSGDDDVGILLGHGDGTFAAQATFQVGVAPTAVAVADLDRDGFLDLAVTNSGAATVSILRGRGDGSFEAQFVEGTGNAPAAVATGDFTGKGVPDLAVVNLNSDTVSVFLGECTGDR